MQNEKKGCISGISIQKVGITDVKAECIVNAANSHLAAGSGVCGAIFRAAGYDQLEEACRKIGGCETGSAVITPGFRLKARYIIHAVGPIWNGGKDNEETQLYNCYWRSLELARENECHSIAFPLISSGIFGYPKDQAWEVAIRACREFRLSDPAYDIDIIFAVLDDRIKEMGEQELDKQEQARLDEIMNSGNPIISGWPEMDAAIAKWHDNRDQEPTEVFDLLIWAVQNDKEVIIPIAPVNDAAANFVPEDVQVGDTLEVQEDLRFKLQTLDAGDGKCWYAGFTCMDEVNKGPQTSMAPQLLSEMLGIATQDETSAGLLLNPWGKTFAINKELAEAILATQNTVTQDEADLKAGSEAYQNGDFAAAIELYQKAAAAGNVTAMSNLGYCYYYGRSIPVDKEKARTCWEKAAVMGDICATYKLGDMYRNGDLPEDIVFSKMMYLRAYAMSNEGKDIYCYPDACLRILKYCKEDCSPDKYREIAEDAVKGFELRIEDGDHYTDELLMQAKEILASCKEETAE